MKVLFVTAEAYPFAKVGGLGDVALGLPKALKEKSIDIRVIMPKYKFPKYYRKKIKILAKYETFIGWRTVPCVLEYCNYKGIDYYFIDNPDYFYREKVYGYGDDDERFIFFSKAVLEGIRYLKDFVPDILHCNDWHSSMVIPLKDIYYKEDKYRNIKTLFTIHNLAYQGQFGKNTLWMLGIDEERYYTEKELKHNEGINFMKWAISKSDMVTTVSTSYSKEVKEKHYGFGLEKVLKDKDENFLGILNGIDYNLFKVPIKNGTIKDLIKYKKVNKRKLQEKLNLVVDENTPIISVISRLVNQKGISLLISNIQEFVDRGMEIIISGTGESYYEEVLMELESRYKGRVKTIIDFNINLANEIYLSSDLFLAPSKFEPCGLTQMISMRYGTIPIVRAVGGLKDSVKEFNFLTKKGNGFVFKDFESRDMLDSLDRALDIYRNKNLWNKVVENAFYSDNSWNKGAEKYKDIYDKLKK